MLLSAHTAQYPCDSHVRYKLGFLQPTFLIAQETLELSLQVYLLGGGGGIGGAGS